MGGIHSLLLSQLAKDLWNRCLCHNVLIKTQYLPGVQNVHADRESRVFLDSSDWKLNKTIFEVGPSKHRSFRISPNFSTGSVCELEIRLPGDTYRRFHSELGDIPGIRIYLIRTDRSVPSTGSESGGGTPGVSGTSLASPNIIPSLSRTLCGLSPPTANASESVDPTGPKPSTSSAKTIYSCYQTEGISEQTRKILLAAWRPNTTSSYSSAWNIWRSWCAERITVNPLLPSLNNILDFFTSQFI